MTPAPDGCAIAKPLDLPPTYGSSSINRHRRTKAEMAAIRGPFTECWSRTTP